MDPNKPFSGEVLRELRLQAGFTQRELAQRLGISREKIIAIENERPGTIHGLEVYVVKRWWRVCHARLPAQARQSFIEYIKKFLKL